MLAGRNFHPVSVRNFALCALIGLIAFTADSQAQKEAPRKKDAKAKPSPYNQLKAGESPAEETATYFGGELIVLDRINRTGQFRLDRTDNQNRGNWDLPLIFTMLPYGCIVYHGAPAELRDIPLGTHLHGLFYWDDAIAQSPRTKELLNERRIAANEYGFHWVLRFEDDFSYFRRQKRAWRVDAIDLEKKTLTATGIGLDGKNPDKMASVFQIPDATRVWKGNGFGSLADLKEGALVLINFTYRTMKLSGRCTDIWIDAESQARAAARQLEVHRLYQRDHGLAGWVEKVDDVARTMTVTLFEGFDPKLKEDFGQKVTIKDMVVPPLVRVAVAEESLRTYDPINDTKMAPILEMKSVPVVPGSSGWQITCRPDLMLEGFRTRRIVRLYAGIWGVVDLPREEKLFP